MLIFGVIPPGRWRNARNRGDIVKQAQVFKVWSRMLGFGVLMLGAQVASAALLSYTLNCPFGGDPTGTSCLTTSTSFGTVTISDATRTVNRAGDSYDGVDISVALTVGNKLVPFGLYLNFGASANGDWGVLTVPIPSTNPSLDVNFNNIKAGGYSSGDFDMSISPPSSSTAPYSFFLFNTGLGLDPAMFNYMDTGGRYYLAAHIGGCNGDCLPGLGDNSDSIWVGATPRTTQNIPEPSSLLLVGAALAGVIGLRRSRTAN
jgi:hypothetical protein